ncbi:MAG: hypothetical protein IMX05_05500 [Hydrogenibacillus schlegelii]|nr:hypothetical protein [Hydrogenibacillus schlegelii]
MWVIDLRRIGTAAAGIGLFLILFALFYAAIDRLQAALFPAGVRTPYGDTLEVNRPAEGRESPTAGTMTGDPGADWRDAAYRFWTDGE